MSEKHPRIIDKMANFWRLVFSPIIFLMLTLCETLKEDSPVEWPNTFLNVLEIFLLKKENYSLSAFVQSLFSTKKSPKIVNLLLTDEMLRLSFWRHKQDKWL